MCCDETKSNVKASAMHMSEVYGVCMHIVAQLVYKIC